MLREIETDVKIREVVSDALLQAVPWADSLPHADLDAFTAEFLRTIEGAAQLTTFAPVAQLLHEWQATARAHAEGLAAELTRPLRGDGEPVSRPRRRRK